jgi:hypothetical protein
MLGKEAKRFRILIQSLSGDSISFHVSICTEWHITIELKIVESSFYIERVLGVDTYISRRVDDLFVSIREELDKLDAVSRIKWPANTKEVYMLKEATIKHSGMDFSIKIEDDFSLYAAITVDHITYVGTLAALREHEILRIFIRGLEAACSPEFSLDRWSIETYKPVSLSDYGRKQIVYYKGRVARKVEVPAWGFR